MNAQDTREGGLRERETAGPGRPEATGLWRGFFALLALASVGFHLWLIFAGLIPNLVSRPLHLMLALPWVFLAGPQGNTLQRWSGRLFCLAGLLA